MIGIFDTFVLCGGQRPLMKGQRMTAVCVRWVAHTHTNTLERKREEGTRKREKRKWISILQYSRRSSLWRCFTVDFV
jgi:hypothetical protein